ncbi:TolC family protein [Pedobacter yulinensis]|uniref:TolC family protein n=1 Tax=Pedobacter yulinensis TaxID=2126353 RepID=A0A2T3HRV5_9SPHI|nr:TolC family protein [Pedobacter yulinensis]PST85131.1 TolC family protein [Pedobacter yulinensis]
MKHVFFRAVSGLMLFPALLFGQQMRSLNLQEAIALGIQNSKNLKLSESKIEEAVTRLRSVKDDMLPAAKAAFMYNHAEIPTNQLKIGDANPLYLPRRADAFVGTASVEEVIYGGGRLKFAEESTRLLTDVARLDADKNREEVSYAVINTYYALYKVLQSKKVVAQNLESIAGQLKQAQRFFEQGIVTKNDVLRFQLQQANVSLTALQIESNRKVINYDLDVLLGIPENTEVSLPETGLALQAAAPLDTYLDMALTSRQELRQLDLQNKVAGLNVRSVKANTLPALGVGANLYYINPSGSFIPPVHQFIVPVTLGATLSWNIGSLWTNRNKVADAQIRQQRTLIEKDILTDEVKKEINKNYQNYQVAVNKIQVLRASIAQAEENDRLLASKYKNNVASAIDRIDAETLLYQARIDLELAKADAGLAYYTLLKSTGKIAQ